MTAGLGTPTNRAWREAAIAEGVPQVLVMTGDPIFSDRAAEPRAARIRADLPARGRAFGELLAASGEAHKVAILSQNDDYGKGYVEGFKAAIEGADNIEIVKELTYEATDTSVDAQLTELAGSGADVFFNAMSITPLVISSLQKAAGARLDAELVPAVEHLEPRRRSFSSPMCTQMPSPASTRSRSRSRPPAPPSPRATRARRSSTRSREYTNQEGVPAFPHCVWSWIAAATARAGLQEDDGADARELHGGAASASRTTAPRSCSKGPSSTPPSTASRPCRTCWCRSTTARATRRRRRTAADRLLIGHEAGAVRESGAPRPFLRGGQCARPRGSRPTRRCRHGMRGLSSTASDSVHAEPQHGRAEP